MNYDIKNRLFIKSGETKLIINKSFNHIINNQTNNKNLINNQKNLAFF